MVSYLTSLLKISPHSQDVTLSKERDSTNTNVVTDTSIIFSQSLPMIPTDIVIRILSYLSPQELIACTLLNKSFSSSTLSPGLWQIHCANNNILSGADMEMIWRRCHGNQGEWWKEIFAEWFVSRRNWTSGWHKKRLISLLEPHEAITWYVLIHR